MRRANLKEEYVIGFGWFWGEVLDLPVGGFNVGL